MALRHGILGLTIALAVVAPARAAEQPRFDAGSLARVDAILEFCARVTGEARAADRTRAGRIVGAASEEAVAEARRSPEYEASHAEISAELGKIPKGQAQQACGAIPVSMREGGSTR